MADLEGIKKILLDIKRSLERNRGVRNYSESRRWL